MTERDPPLAEMDLQVTLSREEQLQLVLPSPHPHRCPLWEQSGRGEGFSRDVVTEETIVKVARFTGRDHLHPEVGWKGAQTQTTQHTHMHESKTQLMTHTLPHYMQVGDKGNRAIKWLILSTYCLKTVGVSESDRDSVEMIGLRGSPKLV